MEAVKIQRAFQKTLNSFWKVMPIIIGVVMLVSLSIAAVPKSFYKDIFTGHKFIDPLIGVIFGSVAAGNPATSYIIGGELLNQGVSLVAVTAFILAWVTVGLIQLPAESLMLGKKFAIARNVVSFITVFIVALLTVFTLSIL